MSGTREVRRLPVIVAVVALTVAALQAGEAEPLRLPRPSAPGDAAAMPAPGTRSSASYCVDGPAPEGSKEAYHLTNTGDEPALVGITVMPSGKPSVRRRVELAPQTLLVIDRLDLTEDDGPAVVEPFSADVVVEHQRLAGSMLVVGPCATRPERTWYFAAGTTLRGVEQWLYLFNPFPDDAIVDLSFFTSSGRRDPIDLQGLVVPRRSQVAVAVHGAVRRETSVATRVSARVGRIVAEQSIIFTDDSGYSGVTRSLGALAPALEWYFADGRAREGARRLVSIANPDEVDAEVDVQVVPSDESVVEPMTLAVPREGVVVAQLGECGEEPPPNCIDLPDGVFYSVVVSAATDQPVVVEELSTWTDEDRFTGAASWMGTSRPAKQWYFARSRFANTLAMYFTLFNPDVEPVSYSVAVVGGGTVTRPEDLQGVTIAPGSRARFDIGEDATDGGLVVTADRPIVVERTVVRSKTVSRTTGVPTRG